MADTGLQRNGSIIQIPERFALNMTDIHHWILRGRRIWLRGSVKPYNDNNNLAPWDWEPVYHFVKKREHVWNSDLECSKTSVIYDAAYTKPRNDGGSGFPHQVINECIMLTSKPGDLVMDCFMGSGETAIAAVNMQRRFIGIDLFPHNIALSMRRLRNNRIFASSESYV
jgi:site-specific DNA-methyltransferase (adenine-specific)